MYIRMYSTTCIYLLYRSFICSFLLLVFFLSIISITSASSSFSFYFIHLFFLSFFHHPTPTHHQTSFYIHPSIPASSQSSQSVVYFSFSLCPCMKLLACIGVWVRAFHAFQRVIVVCAGIKDMLIRLTWAYRHLLLVWWRIRSLIISSDGSDLRWLWNAFRVVHPFSIITASAMSFSCRYRCRLGEGYYSFFFLF